MRKIHPITALTACFLVLLSLGAASAQQQTDTSADLPAIKQTVAAFIDAFNRHDAAAAAKVFAEDADRTTFRGDTTHGRKAIEASYASLFAGGMKDAHREATVRSIRLLTPDIALVDSDLENIGGKKPTGGDMPPTKGLLIWVVTKSNGVWSINTYHEFQFSSVPANPAP